MTPKHLRQLIVGKFHEELLNPRRRAEALRADLAEYEAQVKKNAFDLEDAQRRINRLWMLKIIQPFC